MPERMLVTPPEVVRFRNWLVDQLARTRWSNLKPIGDLPIERVARLLGVQPDVLVDAHRLRQKEIGELRKAGLDQSLSSSVGVAQPASGKQVFPLPVPAPVYMELEKLAREWGTVPATTLRTVLHHAMLEPTNPRWLAAGWPWKGVLYPGTSGIEFSVVITNDLGRALVRRCRNLGVTARAFVRGALIDALESREPQPLILSCAQLLQEERYVLLDGVMAEQAKEAQKRSHEALAAVYGADVVRLAEAKAESSKNYVARRKPRKKQEEQNDGND